MDKLKIDSEVATDNDKDEFIGYSTDGLKSGICVRRNGTTSSPTVSRNTAHSTTFHSVSTIVPTPVECVEQPKASQTACKSATAAGREREIAEKEEHVLNYFNSRSTNASAVSESQ